MRKPRSQAAGDSGSRSDSAEEQDTSIGMPPGFGLAGDFEEEGGEQNLEDLEDEGEGEEGSGEEEPEELTPREKALKKELADAQAQIGRQGDELGQLRRGQPEPADRGQGIVPVQNQQGPDPFELAYKQAADDFVRTGDTGMFAARQNQIMRAQMQQGIQYVQKHLGERDAASKSEVDFFSKNTDLVDGVPRSIYEGELAKVKLQNPNGPATEQRRTAADATRTMLQDLNYTLMDEDEAAKREGRRLQGPKGRRSRTGSAPGSMGASEIQQSARDYRESHNQRQRAMRSSG